jgi:DNA replication protein DnaC
MSDPPQVLLQHHLKKLKLPTFQSEHAKLARQCAAEGKDHVQYLLRLCELELIERERRMVERRIKAASATGLGPVAAIRGELPATKSLDSFDFTAIPSLNKALTMELARGSSSTAARTSSLWDRAARARRTSPWASALPLAKRA